LCQKRQFVCKNFRWKYLKNPNIGPRKIAPIKSQRGPTLRQFWNLTVCLLPLPYRSTLLDQQCKISTNKTNDGRAIEWEELTH
jgi:hypothetical protein